MRRIDGRPCRRIPIKTLNREALQAYELFSPCDAAYAEPIPSLRQFAAMMAAAAPAEFQFFLEFKHDMLADDPAAIQKPTEGALCMAARLFSTAPLPPRWAIIKLVPIHRVLHIFVV